MNDENLKDKIDAFDYPNNVSPKAYNEIFYGNQNVPKPTNYMARLVKAETVMRAVLKGK
jgi:hypothetical protein